MVKMGRQVIKNTTFNRINSAKVVKNSNNGLLIFSFKVDPPISYMKKIIIHIIIDA